MDDTTRSIIDKIIVNYGKPTKLPSGHMSTVFFDCVKLSPGDLARLAAVATGHLDPHAFDVAVGVAYGGIFFAAAVGGGKQVAIYQKDCVLRGPVLKNKKVVLVSDIVCKGTELREAEAKVAAEGAVVVGYVCIVDRSEGKFGTDEKPLWSAYRSPI